MRVANKMVCIARFNSFADTMALQPGVLIDRQQRSWHRELKVEHKILFLRYLKAQPQQCFN